MDLLRRLDDRPFRPFRVHLTNGTVIDVPKAGMVIVGHSTAVLPTRFATIEAGKRVAEDWRTIDLVHIVQFSDLQDKPNGNRRRKA